MPDTTFATAALANIEAALLKLTSGTNESVNINGQEFRKRDIKSYMDTRDRLKAEIARAESAASFAGGRIVTTFIRP